MCRKLKTIGAMGPITVAILSIALTWGGHLRSRAGIKAVGHIDAGLPPFTVWPSYPDPCQHAVDTNHHLRGRLRGHGMSHSAPCSNLIIEESDQHAVDTSHYLRGRLSGMSHSASMQLFIMD